MFTAVLMVAMVGGGEAADCGCDDGCMGCYGGDGIGAGVGGYDAGIGIGDGYDAGIGIGGVVPPATTVPATTTPAQTQQRSEAEAPATIIDNVPAEAMVTAGVNTTQSRYYYNPGNAKERSARITVHLPENTTLRR
jgi:hypothetical protein